MKTAIWLYLFMFVAFFDLHAQYPILTPFAISLGAAPSFIGLLLGVYSITHMPGNIIAGYGVDRYGSKQFIIVSLIFAGFLLLIQSKVTDPYQLLIVRSFSGFVLAFLSPASLALLAKIARDRIHQGKLMAGNGLVHTLASVVSPAAGAALVAKLGFTTSFTVLGWVLIAAGLLAIVGIHENKGVNTSFSEKTHSSTRTKFSSSLSDSLDDKGIPWLFFGIPLALSCAQGILFFELPLMHEARASILTSGLLFSLVSMGALVTLSMLFLNRTSPLYRTMAGGLALAIIFFGISIDWPVPLYVSLFLIGMTKGIIYPAMASLLAVSTSSKRYGRAYSILSIASSIGAFIGPMIAGNLHDSLSPYFIAFLALIIGLALLPLERLRVVPAA